MQTSRNQRIFDSIAVTLVGLISVSYFVTAAKFASVRPFWMDEVLAVWTARLPTVAAVWDALGKGAEFSPPLYILFLQKIIQLGAGNALMLRLPSVVAVYIVGVAAFVLMRRRYSLPLAALAMAICLIGGLFPFALQARPYACVTACFALVLVIWDIPSDRSPSLWRAAAILVLLVIAIGMNFYAVLLAAGVGLMELAWTALHRRVRWLYVAAIALAILSILLWLPIMQHVAAFNHSDSGAPNYYARPALDRLILAYIYLLVGHRQIWFSPLILLAPALLGGTLAMLLRRRPSTTHRSDLDNLNIIVVAMSVLPLLVYFFALEVTHTFNCRYFAVAALGLALLVARLVAALPWSKAVACLLVTAALGISLTPATHLGLPKSPVQALALVDRAPPNLPIATGNGLRFFELRENAVPAIGDRIRYLESPTDAISPDPTNQHQVERWKTIAPQLAVSSIAEFLRSNSRFLLFSDTSGIDPLPALLVEQGNRLRVIARAEDAYLAEVESTTSAAAVQSSLSRP
ncbi:MAG: hypothetical protein WBC64_05645 [Methylovirgula sp.]